MFGRCSKRIDSNLHNKKYIRAEASVQDGLISAAVLASGLSLLGPYLCTTTRKPCELPLRKRNKEQYLKSSKYSK